MALCQYVPVPVVGSYLVFLGLFLIRSGIAMATGVEWNILDGTSDMFHMHVVYKLLPTVAAVAVLAVISRKLRHPLAVPTVLVGAPVVFMLVWQGCGKTVAEGRETGWIFPPPEHFSEGEKAGIGALFDLKGREGWFGGLGVLRVA